MSILGVDVSHWQGTIDWAQAAAGGVRFGIAKASEGTGFVDSSFAANIRGMRANGVVPGAYHFLRSGSEASQVDHFCRLAPPDVIHALDVEGSNLNVRSWVAHYRTRYPSKTLLVYTGRDLWARAGGGVLADGPLWVAGYVPNAYVSGSGSLSYLADKVGSNRGGVPFNGWTSPLMLQFTAAARVPGISSRCDGNVFYGTATELQALTAIDSTTTTGDTGMEWSEDIQLTAEDARVWNFYGGNPRTGKPYEAGDPVTIGTMIRYPTLARKLQLALNDITALLTDDRITNLAALNAILSAIADSPQSVLAEGAVTMTEGAATMAAGADRMAEGATALTAHRPVT